MIRFLADADLNYAIVQGVRRREAAVDFVSALEAGLEGLTDTAVLALARSLGRTEETRPDGSAPFTA